MPQFRQNFITKEWVIIAPERSKRPDQFAKTVEKRKERPAHDPKCPFCPGNENQTPPAVFTQKTGDSWSSRVVPNKFAAVNPELSPKRTNVGKFLTADGFGRAEVVIESPRHDATLATMSTGEVRDVLECYKNRYMDLAKDQKVDMITIFRNHGAKAGTSLEHPHSQIIATPIVPPHVRQLMQQAILYHDSYGQCPHCVMLEEELKQKERIIFEGKHFVVFSLFASHTPFETRIIPKRHYSRFDSITEEEMGELAEILRVTLKKIHVGLNDPDYNFVITSSPISDGEVHYDHCRLVIVPRLTTPAGFEIGSGIFINVMLPEECAKFLRETMVD
jgi:UDPglucose--hexose-1-phosphate uridylyltransferase